MAFKRSETDKRRVVIVDYNHLAHTYLHGGASRLSHTVNIGGVNQVVDTTIPTYTIKSIFRWANKGQNPTAVCFDSPCGCRKAYIAQQNLGIENGAGAGEYKGGRASLDGSVFDSINMTANLLRQAGVCCYKLENYEADDLVAACVKRAKEMYPDLPIDVICNDADLLPLVNEQVSVFYRSRKFTFAESKDIEKKHYVQVMPSNYQDLIEDMSAYKNLKVPYNTLLLAKLLRGDKSDNIKGHPDIKPKLYKELIALMEANPDIDLSNLFRYTDPVPVCYTLDKSRQLTEDEVRGMKKGEYLVEYHGNEQYQKMIKTLSEYLTDDIIEHIEKVYWGINLNTPFTTLGDTFNRFPAKIVNDITGFDAGKLQQEVSKLGIHLPMV